MTSAASSALDSLSSSHWSLSAPRVEPFRALDTQLDCDVGIIGAGYTGLMSALELAAAGRRVVVLEAQQPGWAASGRNVGHIIPMAWGAHKTPEFIVSKWGADVGGRMNRAIATSGRALFELIARYQIECEAQQGYVCVMRTEQSWRAWQERLGAWREFGGRSEVLDRSALQRYVNSPRYAGGMFLPDGGRVNPLSLVRGLCNALVQAGGRIFGASPVTAVVKEGSRWRLETPGGTVRCETVLVGVGAYGQGLFPALRQVGLPIYVGAVATNPLPDKGRSILPGTTAMADVDDSAVFSPTLDERGSLVLSFLVGAGTPTLASALKIVGPRLKRAFPHLATPLFTRLWAGKFLISPTGAPSLMRLDRNLYAAAVCNGLGHTVAMAVAGDLARLAMGARDEELNFPVHGPQPTPGAPIMPTVLRRVIFPLLNRLGA